MLARPRVTIERQFRSRRVRVRDGAAANCLKILRVILLRTQITAYLSGLSLVCLQLKIILKCSYLSNFKNWCQNTKQVEAYSD